ncbi:uncharacterized protein PV07_09274 [Cladophialophora immunda]|uniref:Uncharacterized protein n=1 Tax=Cladophialophora immunda TaxID=569365 RepID=A0A0D2AM35_9EURO|nr:uncharacterized protein PV07_09274 [Cladophialophora immunda]KIW26157.1 hypothetical protein PV07_09274 [Cladophialophora immunda]
MESTGTSVQNGLPHGQYVTNPLPNAAAKLRSMLADPAKIVVCPGVYDGLSTRLALHAGFECLYMTGAGTSVSRVGTPDLGLATLNDMKENAEMIANIHRDIPVIADADTGYGGPIMVGRTVEQYCRAGVAALHLEDQVVNKRCGHLNQKELVSEEIFLSRIRAATEMRKIVRSDIVIIARTDSLHELGFEAALLRLKKAVEVGADVAMLEAIQTREQVRRLCEVLSPVPVLYGMVQGSSTPHLTVTEAQELGIKIIIYPGACLAPTFKYVSAALKRLKETGDADRDVPGPRDMIAVSGMRELIEFDRKAGGLLLQDI